VRNRARSICLNAQFKGPSERNKVAEGERMKMEMNYEVFSLSRAQRIVLEEQEQKKEQNPKYQKAEQPTKRQSATRRKNAAGRLALR